jgi:hypothetical protein
MLESEQAADNRARTWLGEWIDLKLENHIVDRGAVDPSGH